MNFVFTVAPEEVARWGTERVCVPMFVRLREGLETMYGCSLAIASRFQSAEMVFGSGEVQEVSSRS